MPDHTIFNERPESQDRALKVIEKLGYTIVPRSEAEKKRALAGLFCLRKNCSLF